MIRSLRARPLTVTRGKRRGLTLIEAAMSLGVAAIAMVGVTQLVSSASETNKARTTAQRLREVRDAAQLYVQANEATLLAAIPNNTTRSYVIARTASGDAVPANSVQAAGFLPATFVDRNPFNQTHALQVRRIGTKLEAMVVSTGGSTIDDRILGQVATYGGSAAGYMPSDAAGLGLSSTTVYGAGGGWAAPRADWTGGGVAPSAGRLMATINTVDTNPGGDFLNRKDTGQVEDNTMRTDIHMGDNNINGVKSISGTGTNEITIQPTITVQQDVNAGRNITATGASSRISSGTGATSNFYAGGTDSYFLAQGANSYFRANGANGFFEARGANAQFRATGATSGFIAQGNDGYFEARGVRSQIKATGRDSMIVASGANATIQVTGANGYFRGPRFIDSDNPANNPEKYQVDPSDASVVKTLSTELLDADTKIYMQTRGIGPTETAKQVRLSDMLPRMVAQYSYQAKHNDTVPKPNCAGIGSPRIMLYSGVQSWNSLPEIDAKVTPSKFEKVASVNNSGNVVPGKSISVPTQIDFDIDPKPTELLTQIEAEPRTKDWVVKLGGTLPGIVGYDANKKPIYRDRTVVVQTFCAYE